jgi:long-chain acyl-CoA synthetase
VDLAQYERVRKFSLLGNEFSIESGELTPSLKIKRSFVLEKYSEVIEGMYLTSDHRDRQAG